MSRHCPDQGWLVASSGLTQWYCRASVGGGPSPWTLQGRGQGLNPKTLTS